MTVDVKQFWAAVLAQDAEAIRGYLAPGAYVNWHNTNEHFTAEEFIRANCEYPGQWSGEVEREIQSGDIIVTATCVRSAEGASFHAVSFIKIGNGKIIAIDEYWGDDSPPPQWRQALGIGREIEHGA